jgi:cytochrome c-type biogenesis protein CcmH
VKDSTSETARQMRDLVAQRVREGKTDAEIEAEFRAAYGDWIFLSPPVSSWSGIVWLVPLVVVAAGLVLVAGRLRGPDAPPAAEPTATEVAALRERVVREEAAEG